MGVRREQAAVAAGCVLAALLAVVVPATTAAPAAAPVSFPGADGLIAFVSDRDENREIYVMDSDGSPVDRLTETDASEGDPTWSPDGTQLAYTSTDEGTTTLWVMAANGDDPRQVTTGDGTHDTAPAWSPDGGRLAFESDRGGGQPQVWVVDVAGGEPRLLVPAGAGRATDPAWSPDGEHLAYAGVAVLGTGPERIFVADADGTNRQTVSRPTSTSHHFEPDWSPNSKRLAFLALDGGDYDIRTMDALDGGDEREAAASDESEINPTWSPDGRSIAYARGSLGELSVLRVWRSTAGGGGPTPLTPAPSVVGYDAEPAWQPRPVSTLVVDPPTSAVTAGSDVTVRITATDASGAPTAHQVLALRITGAHPRTVPLVTDAEGETTYTWEGTREGTDTALVCVDPEEDGQCEAGAVAATAAVLWSGAEDPRLAFTDDTDALYTVPVTRGFPDPGDPFYFQTTRATSYATALTGFEAGPAHEGEAGGVPGQSPAFVSTRDEPTGEVYLARTEDQPPLRLTCDPGTETHPVVSTGGWTAYASDADGDWDIYVTSPVPPEPIGRVAPFGRSASPRAAAATACDPRRETVNVTDEPDDGPVSDDLWPTWTYTVDPEGSGSPVPAGLVFSRASEGALPDLYRVTGAGPIFGTPTQLTTTADVAETQPAATTLRVVVPPPVGCELDCDDTFGSRTWVAFTTSEHRSSGTIALLSPDDPLRVLYPADQRHQGSEAAWSDIVNPDDLAITTTESDPFGDVAIAVVDAPVRVGALPGDPVVNGFGVVDHGPTGTALSHPHWIDGFGSEDDRATLVVTGRSGTRVVPPGRILDADVSDVHALDGTQRRIVRRERVLDDGEVVFRYDEAGPSYSPDGSLIVYSRDTGADDDPGARLLMTATADGTDPKPLLPGKRRDPSDLDVDPVWSPDGSKVAFVRITGRDRSEEEPEPPEVYVFDLDTEALTRIPGVGGAEGADLSPSWAPDSVHLVLARSGAGPGNPRDAARRWDDLPRGGSPELVVVDTDRPLVPAVEFDSCDDGCAVRGRSPAWSPDGTTIAYEFDGQLETVLLQDTCCDGSDIATAAPVSLVGLDPVTDEPTPSRAVVERAQDPAWSPDGSELAFTGRPVGQPDHTGIWRISAEGTDVRVLTDEPGPESEPAWQDRREADVGVTVSVAGSPAMIDEPVVATFTVTNHGPRPAPLVSLDTTFTAGAVTNAPAAPAGCRGDGSGCDLPVLAPGESRVYSVQVRHAVRVLGVATGMVGADATDPDLLNNTDSEPYRVMDADVAVQIDLDAPIGYVGGRRIARVTVRNVGVDPVDAVEVQATWPTDVRAFVPAPALPPPAAQPAPDCLVAGLACPLGTLDPGDRIAYLVEVRTPFEGSTLLAAEVSTSTMEVDLSNNEDDVALEVLLPELRVLPSVAPPGKVVLAYGEKFPPDSRVVLLWDPGITVIRGSFRVGPDGTLRMPLLVVRHDLLGERELVARSTTGLFRAVRGDLLVVPRTLSPPSFNGRG